MCLFFISKKVSLEVVQRSMQDYLQSTGKTQGNSKKLLRALPAKKMLVYAPLLQWYIAHGAEITAIYRAINYTPAENLYLVRRADNRSSPHW